MEQPASFEGWAIVELFGHQREIGYVTSRYFGSACMFQVDVPELPERDFTLEEPQYVRGTWTPAGSTVRKKSAPARSRLLGPGSIYAMNPCTESAAMLAIEQLSGREIVVLDMPKKEAAALNPPPEQETDICDDCGFSLDACACDEQNDDI